MLLLQIIFVYFINIVLNVLFYIFRYIAHTYICFIFLLKETSREGLL